VKLDRNINGRGKYGLVNSRRLQEILAAVGTSRNARNMDDVNAMKVREAVRLLEEEGILDWGAEGTESEFFVIKLRDENAGFEDPELGADVQALADRAGPHSPFFKKPD
jgi:hypothetical protein